MRQRAVAVAMAAALATAGLAIGAGLWFGRPVPLEARLATLAASAATVGLWPAAAIGRVAQLRFTSPADLDAAAGAPDAGHAVRQASAILQNTLEQAVLALAAQVALAMAVERSPLLLGLHAALFTIGRTLFWAGYRRGAEHRALGFALTFYPSALILLVILVSRLLG